MGANVLIAKKLARDTGSAKSEGVHLRKNLKEIIAVEVLLENEGWLDEPEKEKILGYNMDETAKLTQEMPSFWFNCGKNRDEGVKSILKQEQVQFKDVLLTDQESDSGNKDIKVMLKDLPKMIQQIPDTNQVKAYISELFTSEIVVVFLSSLTNSS